MKYLVQLSQEERSHLQHFIGLPLRNIEYDGWSATAQIGDWLVTFEPDEIATPDAEHPRGDAVRPRVFVKSRVADPLLSGLGIISGVFVSRTIFALSPPVECSPFHLTPTVVVPASMGYGAVFLSSSEALSLDESYPSRAIVYLDVAITISTDMGHSACFFTDGASYFIRVARDIAPECDWTSRITNEEIYAKNSLTSRNEKA